MTVIQHEEVVNICEKTSRISLTLNILIIRDHFDKGKKNRKLKLIDDLIAHHYFLMCVFLSKNSRI